MSAAGAPGPARVRPRLAPAKLNLTLAVVGRREDGYHALHSVMVPLALGDVVALSPARVGARGDTLRIAGLPVSPTPDNLVLKAIAATRDAVRATWRSAPNDPPPLAARLTKRIPVAAGLGGGSSDAATTVAGHSRRGAHHSPRRRFATWLRRSARTCRSSSPGSGPRHRPWRGRRAVAGS